MRRSVVVGFAVLLALGLAACVKSPAPPSDAALIAAFQSHKDAFHATVAEFARAPGLQAVELKGAGAAKLAPKGADAARGERVAGLLRTVGAKSAEAGQTGPDNGAAMAVRFAYLTPSPWGSKSVKGIVYDPAASPQDRVADTDAFARRGEKAKYLYVERQIEGDWYVYQWLD